MRRMTIRYLMITVVASALVLSVARWIYDLDWMILNAILTGLILLTIPMSFVVGLSVWAIVTPDDRWRQTSALRRKRAASIAPQRLHGPHP